MPNGHRVPYRMAHGRAPSPAHSSDSEETYVEKARWGAVARAVLCRWRLFVRQKKVQRRQGALEAGRLLPMGMEIVSGRLAAFLTP